MDAPGIISKLTAYADHLDAHPHLADVLGSTSLANNIDSADLTVLVFDHARGHWAALADWVRTLHGAGDVKIQNTSGHVAVVGLLADGAEITVRTIFHDDEIELLRANGVKVKTGEVFPVELLFRLISTADAEAVSR